MIEFLQSHMSLRPGDYLLLAGALSVAYFLLQNRLKSAVAHEYAAKLEKLRRDQRLREQCGAIAELFAARLSPGNTTDVEKLNRLAWELALWLPAETVRRVTRCLCGEAGAPDPKEILVEVRNLVRGQDDGLRPENMLHFRPQTMPGGRQAACSSAATSDLNGR